MRATLFATVLAASADAARIVVHSNHTDSQRYGKEGCQCIGVDTLEGHTTATLKGNWTVSYPSDLGARCEAWDKGIHPKCPGEPWCEAKWCYVDPCKCKDVNVLPKPSVYIPGAKFQGKPVYFSYDTCGGKDTFSAEDQKKSKEEIFEACRGCVDDYKWGNEKCRCIGIGPQPGTTKVNVAGKMVDFPADTGSMCKAWEENHHPECLSNTTAAPDWCKQQWCYVDPCDCDIPVPPKTSSYVKFANYQGRPVYYSYATCGGKDAFTGSREEACMNQKSKEACGKLKKCAWTGAECWGRDLLEMC